MPFQRGTFCGASVVGFTAAIGWGVGQPSQMVINLVNDLTNGDSFTPLPVGSPAYFSYGNSNFYGLFQSFETKNAIDGAPTFQVVLVDPREILDGTQIIIGAYRGSVGGVPNLVNAFGFWENVEFGISGSNEAGMPWVKISAAIQSICNTPGGTDYGGPLTLNGVKYSLDLSQLPTPAPSYRLGGTSISLMDAIAQICDDGGCDFFVRLIGYTIQVCTVSRRSQPNLGTIQNIVNSEISAGRVPQASVGLEFRNETTSSFVVGGAKTTLFQTDEIKSFWGYDEDGNVIWATQGNLDLLDGNGKKVTSFETEYINLEAGPVADILGSNRYKCSTFEMQCAKGNYDTWSLYMLNNRKSLANASNLISIFKGIDSTITGKVLLSDVTNIDSDMARLSAEDSFNDSIRLFEFVKGYADEYMGKKYAVALPFILKFQEEDTLRIISSYNVVDSGYLEENSNPLGMSEVNEDQFRNADGRFRCFVKYKSVTDKDLSGVQAQSSVVDDGALYSEATSDPQILFDDKPYALVTLSGVLADLPVECAGDPTLLGALLGTTSDKYKEAVGQQFMPLLISPAVIKPDAVAIPLISNLYTYGPWYAAGVAGKVLFEQDSGLTPWDYGDYQTMNNAGAAKVNNAITNMQVSESGRIELVGMPVISIGDVLQAGGPNLTNIDVQVSTQGVTTTYRFQTYTPKFGTFSKGMGERMKRLGLSGQSMRRSLRVSQRNASAKTATNAVAENAARSFKQNMPSYKKKQTPHTLMVAYNFADVDSDDEDVTRGTLQSATNADAITLANAGDDDRFQSTAIMSYNGLFRAFSTSTDGSSTMSNFEEPTYSPDEIPGQKSLNPFQDGHDIETMTSGDEFESLNSWRDTPDNENARLFSLRGPIVITGWGFGVDGSKYPSDDNGRTFSDRYMRQQEKWKTGPLDALWDDNRKVWTCHDVIRGKTLDSLPANGSGLFRVKMGDSNWDLYVKNDFSTGVSGSTKGMAGYSAIDNCYYILSADCASG